MVRLRSLKVLVVLLWVAAAYASWFFAGEYFAPDACLDHGGSFNYLAWECSMTDMHRYIETSIYQVPGFVVMFFVVVAALLASAVLRLIKVKRPSNVDEK
jgi:hypothetical protein